MEQDNKETPVVEENSEATEDVANPTPYKHPNRNLMDKEIETTATEESKEEPDEEKPKEDRPVGVEDAIFKKRYDDLKRHYDETISKHKDEVLKLKKEKEAIASKPTFKSMYGKPRTVIVWPIDIRIYVGRAPIISPSFPLIIRPTIPKTIRTRKTLAAKSSENEASVSKGIK